MCVCGWLFKVRVKYSEPGHLPFCWAFPCTVYRRWFEAASDFFCRRGPLTMRRSSGAGRRVSDSQEAVFCCRLAVLLFCLMGISFALPPGEDHAPPYAPRIYPEIKTHYERPPPQRPTAYYREPAYRPHYEEKGPYPGPPKMAYPPPDRCSECEIVYESKRRANFLDFAPKFGPAVNLKKISF